MFFSNSDSDRLIQFMHFRPRDHVSSRDFDPYGMLRISSQNTASLTPPFATISQLGMCMNLNDGTSEFSTLAEFVIEFGRFRLLRTLPFFRDYIVRKTVGGFYGRIRRIRFERALERVRSRSLLAFTQLLGKDLYLIISTSLVATPEEAQTLMERTAAQSRLLDAGMKAVRDRIRAVFQHVETATGFHSDHAHHHRSLAKNTSRHVVPADQVERFLKVCDQMILGALLALANQTLMSMRDDFRGNRRLFLVAIRSDGSTLLMDPTISHVSDFVHDTAARIVASVGSFSGVISANAAFRHFDLRRPKPDLHDLVIELHRETTSSIIIDLTHHMQRADAEMLSPLLAIHSFLRLADEPGSTQSLENDIAFLKQLGEVSEHLRLIPTSVHIGVFTVEASTIKDEQRGGLSDQHHGVVQRILSAARVICTRLNAELTNASKLLAGESHDDLDSYMQILANLRTASGVLNSYPDAEALTLIRQTLSNHSIRVPNDDSIQWQLIDEKMDQLSTRWDSTSVEAAGKRTWAEKQLAAEVSSLESQASALIKTIHGLPLERNHVRATSKSLEIEWMPRLTRLKARRRQLEGFHATLFPEHSLEGQVIDDCDEMFNKTHSITSTFCSFIQQTDALSISELGTLDLSSLKMALNELEMREETLPLSFIDLIQIWKSKVPLLDRLHSLSDSEIACLKLYMGFNFDERITPHSVEAAGCTIESLDYVKNLAYRHGNANQDLAACFTYTQPITVGLALNCQACQDLATTLSLQVDRASMVIEDQNLYFIENMQQRSYLSVAKASRITNNLANLYHLLSAADFVQSGTKAMIDELDKELQAIPINVQSWIGAIALFEPTIQLCLDLVMAS